jgi:hypothetical protein
MHDVNRLLDYSATNGHFLAREIYWLRPSLEGQQCALAEPLS